MTISTITTPTDIPVVLGNGTYANSLTVESSIDPTMLIKARTPTYAGVNSGTLGNAYLLNEGTITGALYAATATAASRGGAGVKLTTASDQIVNAKTITGRAGANSSETTAINGGNGGAGVILDSTGGNLNNRSGAGIYGAVGGNTGYLLQGYQAVTVDAGNGGDGIDLSGGTLTNAGLVHAGTGGAGSSDTRAAYGGAGGVGASISATSDDSSSNSGTILGGTGGYASNALLAGAGGAGMVLSSAYVTNKGFVDGGAGGFDSELYEDGGTGGAGVVLTADSTLLNDSSIVGGQGGKGFFGGQGGYGAKITGGSYLKNTNIVNGGTAGYSEDEPTTTAGGTGVILVSGTVVNAGTILGGDGGSTGNGGTGLYLQGGTFTTAASAGAIDGGAGASGVTRLAGHGGIGVDMAASTSLTLNFGSVTGGAGGEGYDPGTSKVNPAGGNGGAGITVGAGATLTSGIDITGGNGGTEMYASSLPLRADKYLGGVGGDGITVASGGTLIVTGGMITGGNSGLTQNNLDAVIPGGVGVYLANGASLTTAGTIRGGAAGGGTAGNPVGDDPGDAVQFAAGATSGTLTVDPGAAFVGHVNGGGGGVGLALGGTTAGTLSLVGTQIYGFKTLTFDPNSEFKVGGITSGFESFSSISGFASGDTLDLTDLTLAKGFTYRFNNDVLSLDNGGVIDNFNIDEANGTQFTFSADSVQGTDITTNAPCYLTGTRIATPRGEVPIERLAIGDTVDTLSGVKAIRWIGRRSYGAAVVSGDRHLLPVRIAAHAIEAGVPRRDLWVSPDHAMYVDGLLIPARALVNDTSIVQEEAVHAISYWHLEFDGHAVIHAEGAPAESYADDHSRAQFDNAHEHALLYPQDSNAPTIFCAPRMEEGEAVEAIRRRLAQRGARLQPALLRRAS